MFPPDWLAIVVFAISLAACARLAYKLREAFPPEEEKRKNEKMKNEDLVLEEKPKRRMMLGDDGELLEIVEEEFEE
jgi:hypothetical protein